MEVNFFPWPFTTVSNKERLQQFFLTPSACFLFFTIQGNTDTQAEEDERAQESQVTFFLTALLSSSFSESFNLLNSYVFLWAEQ